jgi:hypothetical protein
MTAGHVEMVKPLVLLGRMGEPEAIACWSLISPAPELASSPAPA